MINHELFFTLHSNYAKTVIGFFRGESCIDSITIDNKATSKMLLPTLNQLLIKNNRRLQDCKFFAVHQGPGPFTTLRVAIATINGLGFATKRPIIGVDGLKTFVQEHYNPQTDYTVALLNAFCNDVYCAFYDGNNSKIETGCIQLQAAIEKINNLPSDSITLIGNAIEQHNLRNNTKFTKKLTFLEPNPALVSLQAVGTQAYKQWNTQQNIVTQVMPIYLKRPTVG